MKAALLVLVGAVAWAADAPRVIYTKSFPGSMPPYVSITVERSGAVAYREMPDDDPERLQLEENLTAEIFHLAEKLGQFKHPLEAGLKVANMGTKTFRWENGSETGEAKFNYSLDENAKALQDVFERITESERVFLELKRVVRHDKLGVNDAVVRVQGLWERKRLAGTEQFLPLLDQVAKNDIYMHMARERAAQLADAIRAAKPKAA